MSYNTIDRKHRKHRKQKVMYGKKCSSHVLDTVLQVYSDYVQKDFTEIQYESFMYTYTILFGGELIQYDMTSLDGLLGNLVEPYFVYEAVENKQPDKKYFFHWASSQHKNPSVHVRISSVYIPLDLPSKLSVNTFIITTSRSHIFHSWATIYLKLSSCEQKLVFLHILFPR